MSRSPNRNQHPLDASTSTWPRYCLYGLTLASDFPFSSQLAPGSGEPDLTFTCTEDAPFPTRLETLQHTYASVYQNKNGKPDLYLYRQPDHDVLRFTDIADFYIGPNNVTCHLLDPAFNHMVEICLLGVVLSFWLERSGICALHASAVSVEEHTVAFVATNTGGKSSLAAILMQAGYPLLSDDILAIEQKGDRFIGRPGYPQMRMCPDQAEHFLGHYEKLELVHPQYAKRRVPIGAESWGTFCGLSQPLRCFYLPERRDATEWGTGVEIRPASPNASLIELLRHSFTPNLVAALGLQPKRLEFLAQLVRQIPIRHLIYPSGWEHALDVGRRIVEDLASLESAPE
jgi:hypothetical protein